MKKIPLILFFFTIALAACGGQTTPTAEIDIANLPPSVDVSTTYELMGNDNVLLIDVREKGEYDEGHIPGITLIPMGEIPNRLSEIPTDKEVIVTCRSGNRSGQITDYLRQQGYTNIHNMDGGIIAWQQAGFKIEQ
jgi:phage shock protein E